MLVRLRHTIYLRRNSGFARSGSLAFSPHHIRTYGLSTSSENASSRGQRLIQAKGVLEKNLSLGKSCFSLHDVYNQGRASLLMDVYSGDARAQDLHHLLKGAFRNSKAVRAMAFQSAFELLIQKKLDEFAHVLRRMGHDGLVSEECLERLASNEYDETKPHLRLERLASCFIEEVSVASGEPLIAASFAIQLLHSGTHIGLSAFTKLIQSLATGCRVEPTFTAYTVTKLIELYGVQRLPPGLISQAIKITIAELHVPFHANYLYDRTRSLIMHHQSFLGVTSKLILANIKKGNIYRAVDLWNILIQHSEAFAKQRCDLLDLLLARLDLVSHDRALSFLRTIPPDFQADPNLIDTSISLFGSVAEEAPEFTRLSGMLKAPLSRRSLSSLFQSFLHQKKDAASEKVLQAIFNTPSGLNSGDFDIIISALLKLRKVRESMDMCLKNDLRVSKLGYVRVFEYLLNTEPRRSTKILEDVCHRVRRLPKNDLALYRLTSVVLRYISTNVKNNKSRSLYLKKAYPVNNTDQSFYDFQKIGLPDQLNELIQFDDHNRISCLNIILSQAVADNDPANIRWCLEELRCLGVSPSDILKHNLNIGGVDVQAPQEGSLDHHE